MVSVGGGHCNKIVVTVWLGKGGRIITRWWGGLVGGGGAEGNQAVWFNKHVRTGRKVKPFRSFKPFT